MEPGNTVIKNHVITDCDAPTTRRGDKVLFMQEKGLAGPDFHNGPTPTVALLQHAIVDMGMQLDARLQRSSLQLRITEHCDPMLACYEGGAEGYGPHIDNADGDGRVDGRILTVILYLNPGWDRAQGGQLAIFEPDPGCFESNAGSTGKWCTVWPEGGTLVFFRADTMLHEVLPASVKRYALSVWFCGTHIDGTIEQS